MNRSEATFAPFPGSLCNTLGLDDESLVDNGRVLPERKLAELLDVGRGRLRRALDVLTAEGRIFRHHGQGTFTFPPPAVIEPLESLSRQVTPHNIMEVRLEVEPALAGLAATRATTAEIGALARLMQATLDAEEPGAYEVADDVFHFRIAELAHNPLFLRLYQSIRAVRRHARWAVERRRSHSPERIEQLGRQHEALMNAISSRDARRAARLMEEHLVTVSNVMLRERASLRDFTVKDETR